MQFLESAIVIDQIKQDKDGDDHGTDLKKCFFIWFKDSRTYSFCDKFGNGLAQGLRVGATFSFNLFYVPDVEWTLTIAQGSDHQIVSGTWIDPDGETEGSYQATAGGGADEKEGAASATA